MGTTGLPLSGAVGPLLGGSALSLSAPSRPSHCFRTLLNGNVRVRSAADDQFAPRGRKGSLRRLAFQIPTGRAGRGTSSIRFKRVFTKRRSRSAGLSGRVSMRRREEAVADPACCPFSCQERRAEFVRSERSSETNEILDALHEIRSELADLHARLERG